MTWPHQVRIGAGCLLEPDIFFKHDGVWAPGPSIVVGPGTFLGRGCEFNVKAAVTIGARCAIGSGTKFVDHDHDVSAEYALDAQPGPEAPITLADDVWLGSNVVVLKGVTIGTGAVAAAGAIVLRDIPPREIWGGVPARKIGERPVVKQASA